MILEAPAVTIDIVLGPDWSSRLIAWYGCGYGGYSHVAPRLRDGSYIDARNDAMTINGARISAGVRRRPAGYLDSSIKHLRYTKPVSLTEYNAWEGWLTDRLGDKYDDWDIIGFIAGKRLAQGVGYYICSQLGVGSIKVLNWLEGEPPFDLSECTPNSLAWLLWSLRFDCIDLKPARK